jgi:hypothetical protein
MDNPDQVDQNGQTKHKGLPRRNVLKHAMSLAAGILVYCVTTKPDQLSAEPASKPLGHQAFTLASTDAAPGVSTANMAATGVRHSDALVDSKRSNTLGALSGAINHAAHEKRQDVFNVQDFGAVGDGATDDRAAIQAAIGAARANKGGTVHFPAGDYVLKSIVGTGDGAYCILLNNCAEASFPNWRGITLFGDRGVRIRMQSGAREASLMFPAISL